MTPIESPYDVRFLTLVSVAIDMAEELGVLKDQDPSLLIAESLYLSNKRIHEYGEERTANKLMNNYPILNATIV